MDTQVAVKVSKGQNSKSFVVHARDGEEEKDLGSSVVHLVIGRSYRVEVEMRNGEPDEEALTPDEFYERIVMGGLE